MEIKEWRRLAIQSAALFAFVFVCCLCFHGEFDTQPKSKTVLAGTHESSAETKAAQDVQSVERTGGQRKYITKTEIEKISSGYIRISKKAVRKATGVHISQDYMENQIQVTFENVPAKDISPGDISRVKGYQVATGKVKPGKDPLLDKMTIQDGDSESGGADAAKLALTAKKLYEAAVYEAEDVYYISLSEPRKLYEHIVVVDAGHGGMDEGTFSPDGKHQEKQYTLLAANRLGKILEQNGIRVYYTRTVDKIVTKKERVSLINRLHPDLVVSIHCNASADGDRTANGVETLYSDRKSGRQITNRRLAQILLEDLARVTGQRRRSVLKRNDLYLLHHAKVPAAIVEIGYMSNDDDLKYIIRPKGQKAIAGGIYQGVIHALEEEIK